MLYSFDNYGHTVNMLDSDGNAVYYGYKDIFTDYESYVNGYPNYLNNHKKLYETSPQKTLHSPINNNGFEDGLVGWSVYAYGNSIIETTSTNRIVGAYSLSIDNPLPSDNGYVTQNITLNPGVYYLSVDVLMNAASTNVRVSIGNQYRWLDYDSHWQTVELVIRVEDTPTTYTLMLKSEGEGTVFFDNLLIYEDGNPQTANLLSNSSFEYGLTSNWHVYSSEYFAQVITTSLSQDDIYDEVLGTHALQLNGSVTTYINAPDIPGYVENEGGGILYFGAWANQYTAPSINNANTGNDKFFFVTVTQYDANNAEIGSTLVLCYNLSYDNWQYVYGALSLQPNFNYIDITLTYQGEGSVLFDGVSVAFQESKTRYSYDEYGRMTGVYDGNGDFYTYAYPEGNPYENIIPETITDQNNHVMTIESEEGVVLGFSTELNVKITQSPNEYGQVEKISLTSMDESEPYFSASTGYDEFNQYIVTKTDIYENTTNYHTNILNGLIEEIENAKGVSTTYEYEDDGFLKKVSINNTIPNQESYVEYTYDEFGNLTEMNISGKTFYNVHFDDLGRMESVEVNGNTIMTYDYWVNTYETGQVSEQTYANDDTLIFIYDPDTGYLSEIQFQEGVSSPETRFEYHYDSLGRLSVLDDIVQGYSEEYHYDSQGNLSTILTNDGDIIDFDFSSNGQLSGVTFQISNTNYGVDYFYNESLSQTEFYDKTTFQYSGSDLLTKDYFYDEALGRLEGFRFYQNTTEKYVLELGYADYTSRVESFTYSFMSFPSNKVKYSYFYDELGNIELETIESNYDSILNEYQKTITKQYIYDGLNQLLQESVHDSSVDCTNVANINACYLKTYDYDEMGNIQAQKTYKYMDTDAFVVDGSIPDAYEINDGTSYMYVNYNGTHPYDDVYAISVGARLTFSFMYYDQYTFPMTRVFGVITSVDTSNVDVNTPGYYLVECYAHNLANTYQLAFGIVVKVGDVVIGDLAKEITYSYNSEWLDQLTSYTVNDGISSTTSTILYDDSGNPIHITNFYYNGTTRNHAVLDWEGRELKDIKIYSTASTLYAEIWYSYNDQGQRRFKYIDTDGDGTANKRYQYYWSGDLVVSETMSNYMSGFWIEQYQIDYIYDYDGTPIGFNYTTYTSSTNYLYVLNLQGDVTKIIDDSGAVYVEYNYDSWGNILSTSGSSFASLGAYNSIRYRSYKYDSEIRMYYLNSRYYNPQIGRFINADGLLGEVGNIQSMNMYAYCANNPVMYTDITGFSPKWVDTLAWIGVGLVVLAAVVLTAGAAGFAFGGLAGAIINGAAIGALIGAAGGALIGAAGGVIYDSVTGNDFGSSIWTWTKAGFGIGAIAGFIAGGTIGGIGYTPSGLSKSIINQAVKTAISDTNKMSHIMVPKHGFGNSISQIAKLMKNTLINGNISIYGSAGLTGNAYVASWVAGGAQVTYVIIDGIIRISDMFPL